MEKLVPPSPLQLLLVTIKKSLKCHPKMDDIFNNKSFFVCFNKLNKCVLCLLETKQRGRGVTNNTSASLFVSALSSPSRAAHDART